MRKSIINLDMIKKEENRALVPVRSSRAGTARQQHGEFRLRTQPGRRVALRVKVTGRPGQWRIVARQFSRPRDSFILYEVSII
jgi:hypothetical protein